MQRTAEQDLTGWFIVLPVKGGTGAKSRLRAPRRLDLAEAMARDTAAAATAAVADPARIVVVTSDRSTILWACAAGHEVVRDPGSGLNAAARAGAQRAADLGAQGVAVLLGDHPSTTPEELRAVLCEAGRWVSACVIDAEGTGTALVTARPPAALQCAFGPGSARAHRALGLATLDVPCPGLRLDVDDDTDLVMALDLGVGPRTAAASLGYARPCAGNDPLDDR